MRTIEQHGDADSRSICPFTLFSSSSFDFNAESYNSLRESGEEASSLHPRKTHSMTLHLTLS